MRTFCIDVDRNCDKLEAAEARIAELTRLQSELAEARAENERLKGQQGELIGYAHRCGSKSWTTCSKELFEHHPTYHPDWEWTEIYTAPPDLARLERDNACLAAKVAELTEELTIERANGQHWSAAYSKWVQTDLSAIKLIEQEQRISELTEQVNVARGAMESVVTPARMSMDIYSAREILKEALTKLQGV